MSSPHSLRRRTDPLIGAVIGGHYRVDARIGEGGMGTVYRATQLAMRRQIALKVLRAQVPKAEKVQLVQRFRREALATSKLRHPNTVSVYDFGETPDGMLYMVLELLEGEILTQVIRSGAPLPPERVAYIGKQITKSLAEAHDVGIVHRDLKPDNIFICNYHGDPDFTKVMDFGIARLLTGEDGEHVTRTGMMVGTPRYIAPEQAMARKVTPAADLYALGVILFEMLTGHAPYEADSAMGLAMAHVHDPIPDLVVPGLPEELNAAWRGLVHALLEKNPKKRPQQAGEVAHWLSQLELDARRFASGAKRDSWTVELREAAPSTYEGPSPRKTVTVSRTAQSDRSALWIALAAVLFMALGGGLAYFLITLGDPASSSPEGPVATTRNVHTPAAPPPTQTTVAATPRPAASHPHPAVATAPGPAPAEDAAPAAAVAVPAAAPASPEPVAEPPTKVQLVLSSRPTGAVVHRGGAQICTTPCDVEIEPSADAAELILTRSGYEDHHFFVDLVAGETVEERLKLVKVPKHKPAARPSLPALRLDTP